MSETPMTPPMTDQMQEQLRKAMLSDFNQHVINSMTPDGRALPIDNVMALLKSWNTRAHPDLDKVREALESCVATNRTKTIDDQSGIYEVPYREYHFDEAKVYSALALPIFTQEGGGK